MLNPQCIIQKSDGILSSFSKGHSEPHNVHSLVQGHHIGHNPGLKRGGRRFQNILAAAKKKLLLPTCYRKPLTDFASEDSSVRRTEDNMYRESGLWDLTDETQHSELHTYNLSITNAELAVQM